MSFLNKQFALLAFLILLIPVMGLAQDTGVPDSIRVGNLDGSNIVVSPGDIIDIPLWVKNDQDVILMYFPIAIDNQYIANYFDGNLYDILNPLSNPHWDEVEFTDVFLGYPSVGFTSYPLFGISGVVPPGNWVPFNGNGTWIKLAEFTFEISNDPSLIGDTIQIIEGENHRFYGCSFVGVGHEDDYHPRFVGGTIEIVSSAYEYLPGDANMAAGGWPPAFIGGDITYLTNYFRGYPTSVPCNLDDFWASADANGDCLVLGNDVTKMVIVMRGIGTISYCPDYEPAWLGPGDFPPTAPAGWPNCDVATINKIKVIPSMKGQ